MFLSAPLSFADIIISCPNVTTDGIIENHDNWSVKMTFSPIHTYYDDPDALERNLFLNEPQINIMDVVHKNCPNPTNDEFKTPLDSIENNGQYDLLFDPEQIVITCPSITVTLNGSRKTSGIFYGENPPIPISMPVTITATKKLNNYSYCAPLKTVPVSFHCRQ